MSDTLDFPAEVWLHDGPAGWYFISLPPAEADAVAHTAADPGAAFGSVRVRARIGTTTWETSLFPDKARGTYLLPVKAAVRKAEGLSDGTPVRVRLELPDA